MQKRAGEGKAVSAYSHTRFLSYDFIGSHGIGEPLPATPFMAGSDGGRIGAFWVVWTAFE
jgi:hypothetical protein